MRSLEMLAGRVGRRMLPGCACAALLVVSACEKAPDSARPQARPQPAPKPEKFALVGEPRVAGQKFRVTEVMTTSNGKVTMSMAGQQVQGTMEMESREVTEYELVSATERNALITESAEQQTMVIMGQPQEQSETNVLVGKPLKGVLEGSQWVFSLAEGDPGEEEAAELDSQGNTDDDGMYPDKALKLGESFKITSSQLKVLLDDAITRDASGSGEGTLEELVDYAGHKCARLSIRIDARGILEQDGQDMQITIKAEGEILRSLEIYENMKTDMTGTLSFGGEFGEAPGQTMAMSVTADLVITTDAEPID